MNAEVRVGWNPDLHSLAITGPASWEQVADGFEELGKNEKIVFKRDQILKEFEVISDMNHLLKRLVSSGGFLLEGVIREEDVSQLDLPPMVKKDVLEWTITHFKAKPLLSFLRAQNIQTQPHSDVFFFHPHPDQQLSYSLTRGGAIHAFSVVKPNGEVYDLGMSSSSLVRVMGNHMRNHYNDKGILHPYIPAQTAVKLLLVRQSRQ
jgi:hypothetical protein